MVSAVGRHSVPRVSERPSSKAPRSSGGSAARRSRGARKAAAKSGVPTACIGGIQSVRVWKSTGSVARRAAAGCRGRARREHVEERLDAGHVAGVAAVLVELQGEDRLVAHDLLGVGQQEAVRPAVEVGEVDGVAGSGRSADLLARPPRMLLAVAPVDVAITAGPGGRGRSARKSIGQHGAAPVRDLLRQAEVGADVVGVVGPADQHDAAARPWPRPRARPLLAGLGAARASNSLLRRAGPPPGLRDLRAGAPERPRRAPRHSCSHQPPLAQAHVDDGREQRAVVEAVQHQGRARAGAAAPARRGRTCESRSPRGCVRSLTMCGTKTKSTPSRCASSATWPSATFTGKQKSAPASAAAQLADLVAGRPRRACVLNPSSAKKRRHSGR